MSNKIQLRRGGTVDREAITPDSGEPCWDTDEKQLYVGDGETAGGAPVVGANVARLDQAQDWYGIQNFAAGAQFEGATILHEYSDLNADRLASGTVPLARMHASVARLDQANTFAAAQTMPAILTRMVMPLTVSAYAVSSNIAVTLTVNDLWVQYWVPSTFTCILTLPPLSTVADGHTIFLMAIAGNSATLKGDGSENIDASDGGFANTATISGSKFALYLCRADTASARWRLIKLT